MQCLMIDTNPCGVLLINVNFYPWQGLPSLWFDEFSFASFDDSRAVLMADWFHENPNTPFHFKVKKVVETFEELQGLTSEHVEFKARLMKVTLLSKSITCEDGSCQSQVIGTFEDESAKNSFDAIIPSFVLDFLPGFKSCIKSETTTTNRGLSSLDTESGKYISNIKAFQTIKLFPNTIHVEAEIHNLEFSY